MWRGETRTDIPEELGIIHGLFMTDCYQEFGIIRSLSGSHEQFELL